ncbi:isoamylase early set domain-containing protein [Vibrio sp.]|nr:isoamylase early set domain-containing protein [Vibrio sp.]
MINKRFFKTKNEVEVTFEVPAVEVTKNVVLMADFLGWEPQSMKKTAKSKSFKFKTRLPKGEEFEFRYLIDGERWHNDPQADQYRRNEFGEDNCLVSTHA